MAEPGSGVPVIPVTLIIPIVNEALTLSRLLAGIASQTQRPAEILFVDGGSTDNGAQIINTWWQTSAWAEGSCQVISNPGGLPGGNRNAGIQRAKQPWLAFLDGGIAPENDWLGQLHDYALTHSARAVSGLCRFDGHGAVELAICALSAGVGTKLPVLPASLFHLDVFSQVGFFPEHLRAAEDLEWLQRLAPAGITREICTEAVVNYRHFPPTIGAAVLKWFLYEQNNTRAGVRRSQQNYYLAALVAFLVLCFFSPSYAGSGFALYWFARGVIDPARRSHNIVWWARKPAAFFFAIILGPCLDVTRLAGTLFSLPQRK